MRDTSGETVTIAYPYGTLEPDFVHSLLLLVNVDAHVGRRLSHRGWFLAVRSANIAIGRNKIVRAFLDDTDSDWLCFIDTDQTFSPDLLERMLESADPVERPILSALIMCTREQGDLTPACVVFDPSRPNMTVRPEFVPSEKLWHVAAVGTGCVLIHRSVLAAMAEKYGHTPWPWFEWAPWPRIDEATGEEVMDLMGEDYTFCFKAWGAGEFPCYVDTTIEVGHIKSHTLGVEDLYAQKPHALAPETFVCIPVKDEMEMTRDLLVQLKEQGGYSSIFVYDNGSGPEMKRWLREQSIAEVFPADGLTIGEMWNAAAFEAASRSRRWNMAYLNNDLRIGDNFLVGLAGPLRLNETIVAVCPNYDDRDGEGLSELHGIYAGGNGDGLAGFAFMVKGELFTMSRFEFPPAWWFTDNYLTLAIDRMGGSYVMVHDVEVEHLDGGSKTIGSAEEYAKTPQYKSDLAEFNRACRENLGFEVKVA